MDIALYCLAAVLVIVGFAGTILPAMPGMPLIVGGMFLAAWVGDFKEVGVWIMVLISGLGVLAMVLDFIAGLIGTRSVGASKWAMLGAGIGALVGLFFGLPGLLLGPFAGAIVGELLATDRLEHAFKAGIGAAVGLIIGGLAKIAIAFMMLGIFIFALIF